MHGCHKTFINDFKPADIAPSGTKLANDGVFALTTADGQTIADGMPTLHDFIADFDKLNTIANTGALQAIGMHRSVDVSPSNIVLDAQGYVRQ